MSFKLRLLLGSLLIASILNSCKKENAIEDSQEGAVTMPGIQDGSAAIEQLIGPEGGDITSSDGNCQVSIPQGALDSETLFSIQRISNTNPLGKQSGYRITPHIKDLKKKALITFKYGAETIEGSTPAALHLAYQNEKGIWMAVGSTTIDQQTKTITTATDHFSDWTLFSSIFINPQNALVEPDNNLNIEVFVDTDFLEPLTPGNERPVKSKINSADKFVKSWTLAGEGSLQKNKAKATYKAPSTPTSDEVTVSVDLSLGDKGQYILLTHIKIAYSGIRLIKDGGKEKLIKAHAWMVGNNWVITGGDDDGLNKIQLSWDGTLGYHSFAGSANNTFLYIPDASNIFVSRYTQNNIEVPSSGGITITKFADSENYIEGNFEVTPTGKLITNTITAQGDASGTFRVKKVLK